MHHFVRRWRPTWILAAFLAAFAPDTESFAQGGGASAAISGIVADSSGAMIPGASITVKNEATAATYTAVASDNGTFSVPALNPGTYTVTVSLSGFKTAVLTGVVIRAGVPASIRPILEVGGLEEVVTVEGASSMLQTETPAVSVTIDIDQITRLPLTSRNALDFVVTLPGVNTPGGNRDSTINGLPQSTINITVDGMSTQDNYLKTTDGFFSRVQPRLDSVEEVTISTAAQDAGATSQGAVQVQFVTRSGTNVFKGTGYYYLRHHALNANTWFNNRDLPVDPKTGKAPKAESIRHQPGFSVGGPIVLPKIWDGHNKGFFFFNYEEQRDPGQITRERNILSPQAQAGLFRYTVGGQTRTVDLLQLAAQNGFTSTFDPTVAKLLADIRGATQNTGQVADATDPNIQRYTFQLESDAITRFQTGRVDFNLTDKHKVYGSYNHNGLLSTPDLTNNREPQFPGFPATGVQDSVRYTMQGTLRSMLTSNLVNEFRVGGTGGRTLFYPELGPSQFSGSLADQGGFFLQIDEAASGIQNAASTANNSAREASTKVIDNTVNWVKGSHSMKFGGSFTQADLWINNQNQVPTIEFDIASGDPAAALFTTANFPNASNTQLNDASDLYAVLVGRVEEIVATARLDEATDEYVYLGLGRQRAQLREYGFFVSDSWRMRPNLTVNLGLRYELQSPFYPLNNSYSTATLESLWGVSGVNNLFKPGVQPGSKPVFIPYTKGTRAYNIDKNNFAPSVGFAWTPNLGSPIFRSFLGGDGDSVLRAGYALAYNRPGMSDFNTVIDDNPGVDYVADRNHTIGNLATPGSLLFRDRAALGPPNFPLTRQYPMTDTRDGDIHVFDPNLQTPYAQTWNVSWQRKLGSKMSAEIRYIGTRADQLWNDFNFNEVNIVENGFLDEFRLAQQNLRANVAAGRGANFRYAGPGTGTVPLPIYLAYFTGAGASQANNASLYSNALFADTTFVNQLATYNPQPHQAANALDAQSARVDNALRAGLPANFLVANPDLLGGALMTTNSGFTRYSGLQLLFDRRMGGGLALQANYSYGRAYISDRYSFRTGYSKVLDAGEEGGITHAFVAKWLYELPFGRERKFGGNVNGFVDRLIGGWSFDGIGRIQSGRLIDFGNLRLVGMSRKELADAFKLRFDDAGEVIYMLPDDIIQNTVKAFSVSVTDPSGYANGVPTGRYLAPANGPDCIEIATNILGASALTGAAPNHSGAGVCGTQSLIVTGPRQVRFDMSLAKAVPIVGRVRALFRVEMLNAFNHPWFTPVNANNAANTQRVYDNADNFRVRAVGENSSRIIQLVARVTW
jgi:hypothetical protein